MREPGEGARELAAVFGGLPCTLALYSEGASLEDFEQDVEGCRRGEGVRQTKYRDGEKFFESSAPPASRNPS